MFLIYNKFMKFFNFELKNIKIAHEQQIQPLENQNQASNTVLENKNTKVKSAAKAKKQFSFFATPENANEVTVSREEMAKTAFGQESNTAKHLRRN